MLTATDKNSKNHHKKVILLSNTLTFRINCCFLHLLRRIKTTHNLQVQAEASLRTSRQLNELPTLF